MWAFWHGRCLYLHGVGEEPAGKVQVRLLLLLLVRSIHGSEASVKGVAVWFAVLVSVLALQLVYMPLEAQLSS